MSPDQKKDLQAKWTAVDQYITDRIVPTDAALDAALEASTKAGLPAINVAPNQGKLLQLLAQMHGAKRILEIGTLGGYSTICLARALPKNGKLITLELNPKHAEVAQANINNAGVGELVEIRVGPALPGLMRLHSEKEAPFDFIFIDADKPGNPVYLGWALKLARKGSVIVCDNVVREGEIVDAKSTDPAIQGTRQLFEAIAAEPRLSATAIQTVGSKGYDGFALALVVAD
jgi:predicted O-methyltransferase YrrM